MKVDQDDEPEEYALPEVAGNFNDTLENFERRCRIALKTEQEKILPDNSIVALLCDAVRLKREFAATILASFRKRGRQ